MMHLSAAEEERMSSSNEPIYPGSEMWKLCYVAAVQGLAARAGNGLLQPEEIAVRAGSIADEADRYFQSRLSEEGARLGRI
jgi:hypothetical protein